MPKAENSSYREVIDGFTKKYRQRAVTAEDGVEPEELGIVEAALGITLPASLRYYYERLGHCAELNQALNIICSPNDLDIDDGYLMIMEDHQESFSWGIKISDLGEPDPIVWQRNNTPPVEWYSEERSFSALMTSMFDYYLESGVWEDDE